jgi:hypothetical protein
MIPAVPRIAVPPVEVSRPLLFGLLAAGAVGAVALEPPHSSFAAGFAAGAGSVFVISFMKRAGEDRGGEPGSPPPEDPLR